MSLIIVLVLSGLLVGCKSRTQSLVGTWLCNDLSNVGHISHFKGLEISLDKDGNGQTFLVGDDGSRIRESTFQYKLDRNVMIIDGGREQAGDMGSSFLYELRGDSLSLVFLERDDSMPVEQRTLNFHRK